MVTVMVTALANCPVQRAVLPLGSAGLLLAGLLITASLLQRGHSQSSALVRVYLDSLLHHPFCIEYINASLLPSF